jgi:hypothetical protein
VSSRFAGDVVASLQRDVALVATVERHIDRTRLGKELVELEWQESVALPLCRQTGVDPAGPEEDLPEMARTLFFGCARR